MSAGKIALHPSVVTAIEEQQTRVWRLRSLMDATLKAIIAGSEPEDMDATLCALIDYADTVHLALDTEIIVARAVELEEDKRRQAEMEADPEGRTRRVLGLDDDTGQAPPANLQ